MTDEQPQWYGVSRRDVDQPASVAANRRWWDSEAVAYYQEHGDFLGDADMVWGPEGWTEEQLGVLGEVTGRRVLEIGGGAAQCSRYLRGHGAEVVASDLSGGMLAQARAIEAARRESGIPLLQCDGAALPLADDAFDIVFTAYGVLPFVADARAVLHEAARVLRPGGLFAFATTHPIRWAFPDDPGPDGLRAQGSYFDRAPYVEEDDAGLVTYVEHHRTLGDWVGELASAGFVLQELIEPEWPADNAQVWGGWSPLRGAHLPGTAIFRAVLPVAVR